MPPAAVAGGASLFGGLMGAASSASDRRAAQRASQQAIRYLESVGIPSIEAQQIVLQNPEFVGQFAPEGETIEDMGPSQMEEISVDPRLKEAQMQALSSLQEQGQMPLSATEKAQLGDLRRDVAQEAQARQGLILQNMAERGAGGSGMELAARLQASQSSAQRQGEESDRMAAMAQERALAAIAQGGQLGGQIRGQEFGEQERVASAADEIARFNAANRQSVQQRNVSGRNTAALREADIRQNLEAQRAATANQQQMHNKQLLQQQFQNQMQKAGGLSAASMGQATQHQQAAAAGAQNWANIGSGVGQAASIMTRQPAPSSTGLTRDSELDEDGLLKKKPGAS